MNRFPSETTMTMTVTEKITPVWAAKLITDIEQARRLAGMSQGDRIVHTHGHHFRRFVTSTCSIAVTRKELEANLRNYARRAIEREQAAIKDAAEKAEVAYWEARGIHTGHPNVATIVLLP